MTDYHPLLQRQIKKHLDPRLDLNSLTQFLDSIQSSYLAADDDRKNLQRSLELSSKELLEKNSELRAVFQAFPDIFLRINDDGLILDYKRSQTEGFYLLPHRLHGKRLPEIFDGPLSQSFEQALIKVKEEKSLQSLEYSQAMNGRLHFYEARILPLLENQIIVIIRNITERKIAEKALKESEQRYALVLRGANDGIWDWDLKTNKIILSDQWKMMLGLDDLDITQDPMEWFNRIHPDDIQMVRREIDAVIHQGESFLKIEHRILHKNQTYLWVLTRGISVQDDQGTAYRLVGSQTDITLRKAAEDQLRHDALHDKLTGLPNRTLFLDRVNRLISHSQRNPDYKFAILFIDLDRFKLVNDSLGHEAGDQLLIKFSKRLKTCLRASDTIARLAGDEFTVLLDDIRDVRGALYFAERIQKELTTPFIILDQNIFITASVGIATNSQEHTLAEAIIRDADTAMYRAKVKGKACHELFDKDMQNRVIAQINLEADLRRAINNKEFEIHYQPIICCRSGRILCMEALLRWNHPSKGMIPPLEFIPLAEESGMILNIGQWVLETVCQQNKKWQEQKLPKVSMAVNFSARQFQHQNLPELIKRTMQEFGSPSLTLELEITESIAIKDANFSVETLTKLKKMGVQISLDDFGVGYSSIHCLKLFPIDSLKIERIFIQDLPQNKSNADIVSAIIALAHKLGLKTVAEGVESKEQFEFLKLEGCDEAQGFYFSRPVPVKQATELLLNKKSFS